MSHIQVCFDHISYPGIVKQPGVHESCQWSEALHLSGQQLEEIVEDYGKDEQAEEDAEDTKTKVNIFPGNRVLFEHLRLFCFLAFKRIEEDIVQLLDQILQRDRIIDRLQQHVDIGWPCHQEP